MKTPEEMAEEYADESPWHLIGDSWTIARDAYLAGYQAAKDTYKDAISAYEDVAKQMLEEAVRIMSPKDQLADADKAMNSLEKQDSCEHILDMEKMVDVNHSSGWISVKERLPDNALEVIAISNGKSTAFLHKLAYCRWIIDETITHWMPLPKPPEDK